MDKINELEIKELESRTNILEKYMTKILKELNLDNKEILKDFEVKIKPELNKGINAPQSNTLRDTLYHKIPAYQYVEITDGGWRIGFTYIDDEDLFMQSLNLKMLDREVEKIERKKIKDINKTIYSISLK